MKKLVFAIVTLVMATSCFSVHMNGSGIKCKGPIVEKSLELKDFTSIVVNGTGDIDLTQADTFSVVVTANEEVFDHIDYRVEDGVLILGTKDNKMLRAEKFEIAISLPVLELITVNGAADVNMKGAYASDKDLTVQVNGAGDIDASELECGTYTTHKAGIASIKVKK